MLFHFFYFHHACDNLPDSLVTIDNGPPKSRHSMLMTTAHIVAGDKPSYADSGFRTVSVEYWPGHKSEEVESCGTAERIRFVFGKDLQA